MPSKRGGKGSNNIKRFAKGCCSYTKEECQWGDKCAFDKHQTRCEYSLKNCPDEGNCGHNLHSTICQYTIDSCLKYLDKTCKHQIHLTEEEMAATSGEKVVAASGEKVVAASGEKVIATSGEKEIDIKFKTIHETKTSDDEESDTLIEEEEEAAAAAPSFKETPKFLNEVKQFLLMNMTGISKTERNLLKAKPAVKFIEDFDSVKVLKAKQHIRMNWQDSDEESD
jgi:hypothetical protein